MIDESIMEKIIPLPDEDEEMEKVQGELEGEGFPITNFKKGGMSSMKPGLQLWHTIMPAGW